jgi:putative acetyltransferase
MRICVDDLNGKEIFNLLDEHLRDMHAVSPPQSVHALDIKTLQSPNITFWAAWESGKLAGCGALKELSKTAAEIKSMRTSAEFRRKGVAAKVLTHVLNEAKLRGYKILYLETGSVPYFDAAIELYKRFGFEACEAFAEYMPNSFSVFMKKHLN